MSDLAPTPPHSVSDSARGRDASEPTQIPSAGWYDILKRIQKAIVRDNVSSVAAGLSMYGLLSFLPFITAAVSLYATFGNPEDLVSSTRRIATFVPPGAWHLFAQQLRDATVHQRAALTGTALIALFLSLWSTRAAMASLMRATNIAYCEEEKRSFPKRLAISIGFTALAIVGLLAFLSIAIRDPPDAIVREAGGGGVFVVESLRWLLLWSVAMAGLAVVYRYAPSRIPAQWRWVIWGSAIAATLWLAGSVLFTQYIRTIGSYGKSYGTLRDVVVLLLWLYLSSFTIVLGAVINAQMERQTRRDTTEGPEKPLGQRGAHAADTVGPSARSS